VEERALAARLEAELGRPVRILTKLGEPRTERATWAVEAAGAGELVVKVRHGDRADEKTLWTEANLPLLAARGYPVPELVWHGRLEGEWYAIAERRLPGASLDTLTPSLVAALLALVELQADAGIDAGPRDFAAYQSFVLFDGWDGVWTDAEAAGADARRLCDRLRRWLRPVWGHRLPAADFAHNDLNCSNVLAEGGAITGVVDWDEFSLNSRAVDLAAVAFDCERLGLDAEADEVLGRIAEIAGEEGRRCVLSYRAISSVAAFARSLGHATIPDRVAAAERLLARLGAPR
jgi:aminoglycoside phosphotransferase (APT) family kinase protein